MTQETKEHKIKLHLLNGNKITTLDALNLYGCFRLASVIHRLRKKGFNILSYRHNYKGNNYSVYEYVDDSTSASAPDENNWIPQISL